MAARTVDLRSDTLTQPTQEMRDAMRDAVVGDDVFGEDPTVRQLEEASARRVGHEAALFMPSGTMVNQSAIFVHTRRRGEIVCEEGSHIVQYEGGAPAILSGVLVRTVRGERGVFTPEQLRQAIRADNVHYPPTTLVCIENTHNRAGGTVWTPAQTRSLTEAAHDRGLPVHLDGARIFNAAVAQELPVERLTRDADSVGFCFSKGLSAPVGSVLCGSADFIQEARRVRKLLGGGMRQAGILAAAGLVALETLVDRLREDHATARRLASGLAKVPGISVDLESVQTNIVICDVASTGLSAETFCAQLAAEGIKCLPRDGGTAVRMVTHRHISKEDVDAAIEAAERVCAPKARRRTPARQFATKK